MKNITTDNIFEDIGFDKQEAANLKVRAELLIEIRNTSVRKDSNRKMPQHCWVSASLNWKLNLFAKILSGKLWGLAWNNHIIHNKNNGLFVQSYSPFPAPSLTLIYSFQIQCVNEVRSHNAF